MFFRAAAVIYIYIIYATTRPLSLVKKKNNSSWWTNGCLCVFGRQHVFTECSRNWIHIVHTKHCSAVYFCHWWTQSSAITRCQRQSNRKLCNSIDGLRWKASSVLMLMHTIHYTSIWPPLTIFVMNVNIICFHVKFISPCIDEWEWAIACPLWIDTKTVRANTSDIRVVSVPSIHSCCVYTTVSWRDLWDPDDFVAVELFGTSWMMTSSSLFHSSHLHF